MKTEKPLYPFGYGLSYTTFEIGKAKLSDTTLSSRNLILKMQVPVTNTGKMDGTEIVQVYVRNPQDPNGPIMQLRGFARVGVLAGRTNTAEITLNRKSFEWFDEETNTVKTKPGTYEVLYGNSSAPEALQRVTVEIK